MESVGFGKLCVLLVLALTVAFLGTGLIPTISNSTFFFIFQLILFQLVIQCSVAAVTYLFIVKQRGTFTAFLAGYGLVIPASLCLSYELIELLDIHNKCLRLALTTASTVLVFRTLEAMHGTADAAAVVESSMPAYAAYYSSAVHYLWDPSTGKRRKIRWTELANSLMRVLFYFHTTSLVLSIELYVDFQPFASRVQLDQYNLNSDLLSPAHIANAYALTLLTFLTLATGFELTAFGENLKGFYTQPIFQNPLFTSRVSKPNGLRPYVSHFLENNT